MSTRQKGGYVTLDCSFDRIAHAYGAQRAHPPDVSTRVGEALAQVVGMGGHMLELGVGTGRIALPLVAAGCRVTGIDISMEMLRVAQGSGVREEGTGDGEQGTESREEGTGNREHSSFVVRRSSFVVLRGDITRLPFVKNTFDAVLAVHVLHLVRDWRAALAEAARVLRPGGAFVQGVDWRDPQSCAERLRGKLREAVMELLPNAKPPGAGGDVAQALAALGGSAEPPIVAAEWTRPMSPAAILAGMSARADAETWALDHALLQAAVQRVRAWASQTWDDLDAPQDVTHRFVLTVTRGEW
jgi:ubiquinone/menaquinone biosynthesis C-methylase UbiE